MQITDKHDTANLLQIAGAVKQNFVRCCDFTRFGLGFTFCAPHEPEHPRRRSVITIRGVTENTRPPCVPVQHPCKTPRNGVVSAGSRYPRLLDSVAPGPHSGTRRSPPVKRRYRNVPKTEGADDPPAPWCLRLGAWASPATGSLRLQQGSDGGLPI